MFELCRFDVCLSLFAVVCTTAAIIVSTRACLYACLTLWSMDVFDVGKSRIDWAKMAKMDESIVEGMRTIANG